MVWLVNTIKINTIKKGGGAYKAPIQMFTLIDLISELCYCTLGTSPKNAWLYIVLPKNLMGGQHLAIWES